MATAVFRRRWLRQRANRRRWIGTRPVIVIAVIAAVETDAALTAAPSKARAVAVAAETDLARFLGDIRAVALAEELDEATPVLYRFIGPGVYDPELLQVLSDTSTGSLITVDFAPAAVNSMLLLFVASDTTAVDDPVDWNVPAGSPQDGAMQLYGWYQVAVGGETSVAVSLTGAASSAWAFLEVGRASVLDVSAGQFSDVSGGSYATPTVAPTTGRRFAVGAVAGRRAASQANSVTDWTNSYAELVDVVRQASTSISLALATYAFDVLEADTTSTTATFQNTTDNQASMLMVLHAAEAIEDWTLGWTVQVGG